MKIIETTFRKMIMDYVYWRPEYKRKMKWKSGFSKEELIILLEERPHTQESLGYNLVEEKKQ